MAESGSLAASLSNSSTGTGIVPPDNFTLENGDSVSISITGIGTLNNPVVKD